MRRFISAIVEYSQPKIPEKFVDIEIAYCVFSPPGSMSRSCGLDIVEWITRVQIMRLNDKYLNELISMDCFECDGPAI